MHKIKYRFLRIMYMFVCTSVLCACGRQTVTYVSDESDVEVIAEVQTDTDALVETEIPVYVCGAVQNPGVYYLPVASLKCDALEAAGGFVEGAALDFVNLAEQIVSGEQIYFPTLLEIEDWNPIYNMTTVDTGTSGKVKINKATKEQFMTLPGIGESKADAIVAYREEHGSFQSIEDLQLVPGIKEGVYNKIKDYIVLD